MIGQLLGHYRILDKLGAGGMGVVYRAHDDRLQRDLALKFLPDEALGDEGARTRLVAEARSASALSHPHICTIYDIGENQGRTYIAMEFVEGQPLAALIPCDGLPAETVVRYAVQIADALAHAHDRGIVHRDIKSSNIMVGPGGQVKVLDFGLAARLREEEAAEATRSRLSLAEQGAIVGTLHYLAPEVLRGGPATFGSDLWALGVVLYEMATGDLPFQGQTGFEVTAAILHEIPRPLPAHIPAALQSVIEHCLTRDPAQRYQRAAEVRAALEAVQAGKAPVVRMRAPRKMLYKARTELRGKGKSLAIISVAGFAGCLTGVYGATGMRHTKDWVFGIVAGFITAVIVLATVLFFLRRWSFVVYPDKIRVKSKRRSVDISFEQIESVELMSYRTPSWQELSVAVDPRFKKLGEASMGTLWGLRHLVKVKCSGMGRQQGYYLDMDKPERFYEMLSPALGRYRFRHKPS